ncbi:MAG TPA: polyketide cyclase / dehydrase and lipid transport [Mycobacteriales bacterium]|nr:polyketide cyclase / dehydrase and lipid transport [Mycobacteriales bacterium]
MAALDLVDETFVVAHAAAVAAVVRDPARWERWWPDLRLGVFQDRGDAGVRWNVRGALTGSMEVWLEPYGDGVLVHHYVRCDPVGRDTITPRERRARQRRAKQVFWALKDELEGDRRPGEGRP